MKIRNSLGLKMLSLGAATVMAGSVSSQAQTIYYLQANSGNIDWTTNTAVWWDQPNGGGSQPANAAALAGQIFNINGYELRTANFSSTFPGSSLILGGGEGTANLLTLRGTNATQTVSSVTATGGTRIQGIDPGTTFSVGTFKNASGTTALAGPGTGTGTYTTTYSFDTLTGSGDFSLRTQSNSGNALNAILMLDIGNATGWTGTIDGWLNETGASNRSLTLAFGQDTIFGGSLIAPTHARITLDYDITFASVTLGGTSLAAGTYDFTYLNTNFGDIFNDGGTGSITVVPEPATLACVIGGLGFVLIGRRRMSRVC